MVRKFNFFAGIFLFLLLSCKSDTVRIQFLYDNVSQFQDATDICIFMNDSLVLNETLVPHNVADAWKAKIVEVKKGKYKINVKSTINQLDFTFDLNLDKDTNCIVEYQHGWEVDSLNTGLIEGKKKFLVMPVSFRH
jgi:hypothetical protein